jgi:hypothetical protein
MKLPNRRTLDKLGITRPTGEKVSWSEILVSVAFIFVLNMTVALTAAPYWQWLIPVATALLSAAVFRLALIKSRLLARATDQTRRKVTRRSNRRLLFFSLAVAGVVLGVSAGTLFGDIPRGGASELRRFMRPAL